jgi:hypothetical protein
LGTLNPEIPLELEQICARAMSKRPEDRYPTCHEFAAALRNSLVLPTADDVTELAPTPWLNFQTSNEVANSETQTYGNPTKDSAPLEHQKRRFFRFASPMSLVGTLILMPRYLKLLGAVILLVSLPFPMATTYHFGLFMDGYSTDDYAFSNWIVVLSFFCSILVFAFILWREHAVGLAPRILELLLLAWSFFLVYVICVFTIPDFVRIEMRLGGYLAFLALGLYATGAVWQGWRDIRSWVKLRPDRGELGATADGGRDPAS